MRKGFLVFLLVSSLVLGGGLAEGSVLVADSFLTGTNSSAGEYTTGSLYGQAPTVGSFSGSWNPGMWTYATDGFQAVDTGLTYTDLYGTGGGAVQFTGSADYTGWGSQAILRNFTAIEPVGGDDYYMSGLMSFDASFAGSPTATAFTGFLNAEEGDWSVPWTIGTQWGFQVNATGGVDAVILQREKVSGGTTEVVSNVIASNITPGTYQFTVHVTPDYIEGHSFDLTAAWLNPDAGMDEYLGADPQYASPKPVSWLQPDASGTPERLIDTLVFTATDVPDGSIVTYDEVRLGDTWEGVVAAPGTTQPVTPNPLAPISLKPGEEGYDITAVQLRANYTTPLGDKDELLVGGLSDSMPGIRDYIEFDLSGVTIPSGSSLAEVSLDTFIKRTDIRGAGVGTIELRLADPTAAVVEMEANWTNANATDLWDSSAGDPTTTILGAVDGDALAAGDQVRFNTQALLDAVNAALAGDGLLKMTFMSPFAEDRALNYNERNFVGFYSDDSDYVPTLSFSFNDTTQSGPTGELATFTPQDEDGTIYGTIRSGQPDENAGDSQEITIGATGYEDSSKVLRSVASIPVSESMIPEGKEVTGVLLKLTVTGSNVDGAGLGDIELRLCSDGAAITEEGVTWNSIDGTTDWTTPGGDLGTLLSTLDSDYGLNLPGTDVYFESTAEFLAAFEDALATDGLLDLIMLAPDAETYYGLNNYILFGSDDNSNLSYRPELILQLQDASPNIPGDANKDGKVDGSDVTILANNWQHGVGDPDPDATWAMGDFNGDGMVDGSDVTILANNWQYGVTGSAAAVPEPAMVMLILSALACLVLVRRK